jgi:hypothetical protein
VDKGSVTIVSTAQEDLLDLVNVIDGQRAWDNFWHCDFYGVGDITFLFEEPYKGFEGSGIGVDIGILAPSGSHFTQKCSHVLAIDLIQAINTVFFQPSKDFFE